MSPDPETNETHDLQIFSKRVDQLLKHKNHIIEVLQEEVQKLRTPLSNEGLSKRTDEIEQENRLLRTKVEELTVLTSKQQFDGVFQLEQEIKALRKENQILLEEQKKKDAKLQKQLSHTPDKRLEWLENEVQVRNEEIENLKARLGELLIVQNRADQNERELNTRLSLLNEELEANEEEISRQRNHLVDRSHEITDLELQIKSYQEELLRVRDQQDAKNEELKSLIERLSEEKNHSNNLQIELDAERNKDDRLSQARGKMSELTQKVGQQENLIESLKTNLESLSNRFSGFLFQGEKRELVFRRTGKAEETPEVENEHQKFKVRLPFCFPDNPPKLLPVVFRSLQHSAPRHKEKALKLSIYKPVSFFKIFFNLALPAPQTLQPSIPRFPIESIKGPITPRSDSFGIESHPEDFLKYNSFKHNLFFFPLTFFLTEPPSEELQLENVSTKLEIFTESFRLLIEFLASTIISNHRAYGKIFPLPFPFKVFKTNEEVSHLPILSKFSDISSKKGMVVRNHRSGTITIAREPLLLKFPPKGISMLLKGVSESIISLTSRLDRSTRKET